MTKKEIQFQFEVLKKIKARRLAGHPAFGDNGLRKMTIAKLQDANIDTTGY